MKRLLGILFLLLWIIYPVNVSAIDSKTSASWQFTPQNDGTFNINISWQEINNPGITGYSVSLTAVPGSDPGPLVDTVLSNWTFTSVREGIYYFNIKHKTRNGWSQVYYWKIEVPQWHPPNATNTTNQDAVTLDKELGYYPLIFTLLLSFGGFSLLLLPKYRKLRKQLDGVKNIDSLQSEVSNFSKYTYAVFPNLVPIIQKPRKITYYTRYRRRYYR